MHTEHQIIVCSNCGAKIAEVVRHNGFQAGGSSIGPSTMQCAGCGSLYSTGQSEWAEKSFIQRAWFVIQRFLWMIASSICIGGMLALFGGYAVADFWDATPGQVEQCQYAILFTVPVLLGLVFWRSAVREIRESRERTGSATPQQDAD